MNRPLLIILLLTLLITLPTAGAKPSRPDTCDDTQGTFTLRVGEPRCNDDARGWTCVHGRGAKYWMRGGLYLQLTQRCPK